MPGIETTSRTDLAAASEAMMLMATIAIAGAGAVVGSLPRIVMPEAGPSGIWPLLLCIAVGAAAATALILPSRTAPLAIVIGGWTAAAIAAVTDIGSSRWDAMSMVSPAQSAMIASSLLALSRCRFGFAVGPVAAVCAAAGLLLFGIVHLTHSQDVASLLPAGFPLRSVLPLFSGGLLVACSIGTAWPATRYAAAMLASTIFLAWLPLVHAPRIAAQPGSVFEWQFASLGLALAGALLAVAAITRPRDASASTSRRMTGLRSAGGRQI